MPDMANHGDSKTTGPVPTTHKIDQILASVRARHGASLNDLSTLTGWQPHSIRAALTKLRQRGYPIELTTNRTGIAKYRSGKAQ